MQVSTIGVDLAKNVFQVHGTQFCGLWCPASDATALGNDLICPRANQMRAMYANIAKALGYLSRPER